MSLRNLFFGPVDIKYCTYFYMLSLIQFSMMILALCTFIYLVLSGNKDSKTKMTALLGTVIYGMFYLQNRIIHSMCIKVNLGNPIIKKTSRRKPERYEREREREERPFR